MVRMKAEAELLQAIGLKRADLVGTAHVVPELKQKRGNAAHPAPGHP
jgi:hypothetical protein